MRRSLIALLLLVGPLLGQAAATCPTVCVVVISGTTPSYTATSAFTTYEWTGTATGRVETIGTSCASSNSAVIITKDGVGNAGVNPIAIYSATDTIDGVAYTAAAPLMLNTPFQAITLQCDGAGNWMIE